MTTRQHWRVKTNIHQKLRPNPSVFIHALTNRSLDHDDVMMQCKLCLMLRVVRDVSLTNIEIGSWISNYAFINLWYVIMHPNFNGGLSKPHLMLKHGWVIVIHKNACLYRITWPNLSLILSVKDEAGTWSSSGSCPLVSEHKQDQRAALKYVVFMFPLLPSHQSHSHEDQFIARKYELSAFNQYLFTDMFGRQTVFHPKGQASAWTHQM